VFNEGHPLGGCGEGREGIIRMTPFKSCLMAALVSSSTCCASSVSSSLTYTTHTPIADHPFPVILPRFAKRSIYIRKQRYPSIFEALCPGHDRRSWILDLEGFPWKDLKIQVEEGCLGSHILGVCEGFQGVWAEGSWIF